MSLDVYLTVRGHKSSAGGSGIFVREDGQTKEISMAEWDRKFPGREPIVLEEDTQNVFSCNITHNLSRMAWEASLYMPLWRPDEVGIERAEQLIEPLESGLARLKSDPERFKQFNPANGWGSYEALVEFVERYLEACKKYPEGDVRASR